MAIRDTPATPKQEPASESHFATTFYPLLSHYRPPIWRNARLHCIVLQGKTRIERQTRIDGPGAEKSNAINYRMVGFELKVICED
jgi:hypothetical protein